MECRKLNSRATFRTLFGSKRAKVIALLLLVSVISSTSASVYAFFYAGSTSTVRAPDIALAAGPDSSGSCSVYPCATVSLSGTSDTAAVTISMFKADATYNPPPSSYYSNLIQVKDSTNAHSILSIQIISITSTSSNDFGKIIVYYCTSQTEFTASGTLVTPSNCVGSYSITSTTGGSVSGSFPVGISAGSTQYIELVAYAGSSGSTSDTLTFKIAVEWT
jgi:hypothetical protein